MSVGLKQVHQLLSPFSSFLRETASVRHGSSRPGLAKMASMAHRQEVITEALHPLHARFSENPKMSHEKAAKREGIIMKLNRSEGLTCYVDADFTGNWTPEQVLDPRACLSRTGFAIFHANCPIAWHGIPSCKPLSLCQRLRRSMLLFQLQ